VFCDVATYFYSYFIKLSRLTKFYWFQVQGLTKLTSARKELKKKKKKKNRNIGIWRHVHAPSLSCFFFPFLSGVILQTVIFISSDQNCTFSNKEDLEFLQEKQSSYWKFFVRDTNARETWGKSSENTNQIPACVTTGFSLWEGNILNTD